MSLPVLDAIKTRRVIRSMTDQPVERKQLEQVLEAARWAPSAGNRRPHRFVAIKEPLTIRVLRMVSPGMIQRPTALVLTCIDWDVAEFQGISRQDKTIYVDVGTAAQSMMLAAHAMGVGSGPVTSFSKEAVRVVLNMPSHINPEMFICLGHATPTGQRAMRAWGRVTRDSLTYWERFPSEGNSR